MRQPTEHFQTVPIHPIRSGLDRDGMRYRCRLVSLILDDGKLVPITGTVRGYIAGETPSPHAEMKYTTLLFSEYWMTADDLLAVLHAIETGTMTLGEHEYACAEGMHYWSTERVNRWHYRFDFAGLAVTGKIFKKEGGIPDGPLAARAAPLFAEADDAARYWLEEPQFSNILSSREGDFILELPSTAPSLLRIDLDENTLRIEIDKAELGKPDTVLKVTAWTNGVPAFHEAKIDDDMTIELECAPDRWEAGLVSGEKLLDTVCDSHLQHHASRKPQLPASDLGSIVNEGLSLGEGTGYEFKEFVPVGEYCASNPREDIQSPRKPKSKLTQVAESVCAMANTDGGFIVVGIADDLEIVGVDDAISKILNCNPTADIIQSYAATLRGQAFDRLIDCPLLGLDVFVQGNKSLVLLRVPRSDVPVSFRETGKVFIRLNASNAEVGKLDRADRFRRRFPSIAPENYLHGYG